MPIIKTAIWIFSFFGFLGWWELIAALMVAIGCLGEFWILINRLTQHIEELPKSARAFWRTLARIDMKARPLLVRLKIRGRKISGTKEHLLERFFVLLVGFGVAMELIAIPFSLYESAKLNEEASQAKKEAAEANERAGKANQLAAQANERAATTESNNLVLHAKLQPRIITAKKQKDFIEFLRNDQKGPVKLGTRHPDNETQDFMEQITDLLTKAGFTIQSYMNYPESNLKLWHHRSIGIIEGNASEAPVYADRLLAAFNYIGFPAIGVTNEPGKSMTVQNAGVSSNEVMVFVIEKQNPP